MATPPGSAWRRLVLPVQPDVLHAAPIVGRVVGDEVSDVWPLRVIVEAPAHDRTRRVHLELFLDLPDDREALLRIDLPRLLLDQLHDLVVAVIAVVPWRPARVVLVKGGVRVVQAEAGEVR